MTKTIEQLPHLPMIPSTEEYAKAREQSWIATSDRGFEVLTHDPSWDILSDKQFDIGGGMGLVLDAVGISGNAFRAEWDKQLPATDGARHAHLRPPYVRLLSPANVSKLQDRVRELINGILDDIEDPTDVDFMRQVATRLPSQLFCVLIAAPIELAPEILKMTESIAPPILNVDRSRIGESEQAYWKGLEFIKGHIEAKRKEMADDFASELIRCEQEGMIEPDEVDTVAMSLLIASMDNTMHQIGLTFGTLLEDRTRWEQVLANPTRIPRAAEETYRLCPRFNVATRHTSQEIPIDDFVFPADSWIWIATRSAGRDETKFEAPDEFRLDRPPSRALQFGSGNYNCLGATLARLEITETIRIVAERYPDIRMIEPWQKSVGPITTECEKLRVSLV